MHTAEQAFREDRRTTAFRPSSRVVRIARPHGERHFVEVNPGYNIRGMHTGQISSHAEAVKESQGEVAAASVEPKTSAVDRGDLCPFGYISNRYVNIDADGQVRLVSGPETGRRKALHRGTAHPYESFPTSLSPFTGP